MKRGQGSARRAIRLAGFSLPAAAGLVLALALGVAGAAGTLPLLGSFGSQGTGNGQFELPRGVAVDDSKGPSRGDVYVAEQGNQRVDRFSSVGTFVLAFGRQVNETKVNAKAKGATVTEAEENVCTAASGDVCTAGVAGTRGGQFNAAMGVAVDPSSGDVYVVDWLNHRIEKFGPAGEFLLAFGKNVDMTKPGNICTAESKDTCQAGKEGAGAYEFEWALDRPGSFIAVGATGTVYVGDENRVQEFESTGQSKGEVKLPGAGQITALAVDSSGDLYAVSRGLTGVRKYDPTGKELAEFDAGRESSQLKAVAVQPGSGDIYLLDTSAGARVRQYTPTGLLSAESGEELLDESSGVAAGASGTVYVGDFQSGSVGKVLFFGEPPHEGNPPPAIDAESAAELGEESAALAAQINPYFLETNYRVQYVSAASYNPSASNPYAGGGEVPSPPGRALGGGAVLADQPASVTIQGLSPGTAYHFRFIAQSSAGTTNGPDQTFTTFKPGGLPGLPDGRVYEQVSSQKKNGNEAGIELNFEASPIGAYAAASPGGDRVTYYQQGPSGDTSSGTDLNSVSSRDPSKGWQTAAALPPPVLANVDFLGQKPLAFLASADLSRFLFVAGGAFASENAFNSEDKNLGLYRTRGNSSEPEWLSRPNFPYPFSQAKPKLGTMDEEGLYPVGGSSPDLGTVYFTYLGTLEEADATRAPFVQTKGTLGPWGFYEWKEGKLSSAGVLPPNKSESPYPGKPDPYGAVPAVTLRSTGNTQRQPFPRFLLNEVSQDGSKAFFVSPEPQKAIEAKTPTELYVREQTAGGPKTVLVSRDELKGGTEVVPAAGSGFETAVTPVKTKWAGNAYVYASPDGSRAFFVSRDKLAKSAAGEVPTGSGPWTYEFNVASEKVIYLPGVVGPIASSSQDGSSFIFKNPSTRQIELWSGGPAPVEVGSFSTPSQPQFEGAAAKDGSVFVFNTNAVLTRGSQTFNNSGGMEQSYRYDVSSQRLSCVSCAPTGAPQAAVEADGSAHAHMIADEGGRVFFATAAKLLARDVNHVTDVYEWERVGLGSCSVEEREGGCVYLISSGTSPDPSFYLENDETGDNVFFSTREGLAKGDTDESYDVYDARVNGGFPEETSSGGCGSACRTAPTPPSLAPLLTTTLGPSGNLAAPAISVAPSKESKRKSLTRAQQLANALKACKKKPKRSRAACQRQARARYATKAATHNRHRRGR